jgi:hypothetical protein
MKLLIVENEPEQVQLYLDVIESYNKTSEVQIEAEPFYNLEDAKEALNNGIYDAAIVDLKLTENTAELQGMEIVNSIIDKLRFPVFIVSGSIGQIDSPESALFKKRLRDGDFKEILKEIEKIYNTGITKILNNKGTIEEYLNNIFWNHLSNSMENWIDDDSRSPEQKQKSLLRYTLMHMQEYIDEDIEKYHPSEFYIIEPIKSNIFTGDIITFEGNRYIVLTPSCDIVLRQDKTRNTKKILFCKIQKLSDIIDNYSNLTMQTGESNSTKKNLTNYIKNNSKQNFHFIPKNNLIEAGLIDFQDKLTIAENEVNDLIKNKIIVRNATVSMPFLKDIISRYSNYYSRQGSPDFNSDEIYSSLFE